MNQRRDNVLLTRRRWDRYFLPSFLCAAAIAVFQICARGNSITLFFPVACMLAIWISLRSRTQREGERVPTISSQPGLIQVLSCGGAGLASFFILILIDHFVFGHRGKDLKPYHAALFAPPFIIILGGVFWADRIRAKSQNLNDQNENVDRESAQQPRRGE